MLVTGNIRQSEPRTPLTVVALDIDFRSEQTLGRQQLEPDQTAYRIEYTERHFARVEKHSADLVVRVLDEAGNVLAESAIFYNAPDVVEGIDFILELSRQPEPEPELTEYERLLAELEPITEGVAPAKFVARDIEFLSEELQRRPTIALTEEKLQLRERLGFLRLADQWQDDTAIPRPLFYGGLRKNLPDDLDAFLALPERQIITAIREAVAENIIPAFVFESAAEALSGRSTLRRERGQEQYEFTLLRLLDAETGRPLRQETVDIEDADSRDDDRTLGQATSDKRGLARLRYPWPADAAPGDRRRLRLSLLDDDGEPVVRAERLVHPDEPEPIDVRFERPATDLDTPTPVQLFGQEHGAALGALGVNSLLDLAREGRPAFVTRAADALGEEDADSLHHAARVVRHMIQDAALSNWIAASEVDDEDGVPPAGPVVIPEVFQQMAFLIDCSCKDCSSALSPGAYLAQLLAWIIDHLRDGDDDITLTLLQEQLHQRFGQIPSDCSAVEEKIRQVRLAIEVLRGFTGLPEDDDDGPGVVLQPPGAGAEDFTVSYRTYRIEAYRAILGAFGLGWEDLRDARLATSGTRREQAAARLGITPDDLDAVFFDISPSGSAISEASLESVFGLPDTQNPFAERTTPELLTLQRQRLADVWQNLDLPEDAFGPAPTRPMIEPDVITADMIRNPPENAAIADLFTARRTALDDMRTTLKALEPGTVGPEPLVQTVLATDLSALRALADDLAVPETMDSAIETIADLHLSREVLPRLIDLADRFEQSGSLDDDQVDDALSILLRAHRQSLHAAWIEEEAAAGAILGPQDFVPRTADAPTPHGYLAARDDLDAWDQAFDQRRRPTAIDPAVLTAADIHQFADPGHEDAITDALRDAALEIYEARLQDQDTRAAALEAARDAAPDDLAGLEATLATSTLGGGIALIDELADRERSGRSPRDQLDALDLSIGALRHIRRLQARIADGLSPSAADWRELDGELLALHARRQSAVWREEERAAGIFLHPQLFRQEGDDLPAERDRRRAIDETLDARRQQGNALEATLAQAVDTAEEATLTILRDALIRAAEIEENGFEARTDWLEGRLLIDLRMSTCAMTTRVAFAAETLSRLARHTYQSEAGSQLEHLSIDTETFETEFPVLRSYQTFRALALAYLYPETALGNATPPKLSEGYAHLLGQYSGGMTQDYACQLARDFSDYFADVSDLEVEATCQARMTIPNADPCSAAAGASHTYCHMFGRARATGHAYASRFQSEAGAEDTQTTWQRIDQLDPVEKIIGAIPHDTPTGGRLIVVITIVDVNGSRELQAIRFDLETRSWDEPTPLSLPPGAGDDFQSVAIQKSHWQSATGILQTNEVAEAEDIPSYLLILGTNGILHLRALSSDAKGWQGGWHPLYGSDFELAFERPLALVQKNPTSFVAFVKQIDRQVRYRLLSHGGPGRDTGTWHSHGKYEFKGALAWPTDDHHLYIFNGDSDETRLSVFNQVGEPNVRPLGTILKKRTVPNTDTVRELEKWLRRSCGVSLTSFVFNDFHPEFFYPLKLSDVPIDPLAPGDTNIEQAPLSFKGFSGTMFDFLRVRQFSFDALFNIPPDQDKLPEDRRAKLFPGAYSEQYLLAQFFNAGLNYFASKIAKIEKVHFTHERLGAWKLADQYVRFFLRWSSTFGDDADEDFVDPAHPEGLVHVLRLILAPTIEELFTQETKRIADQAEPGEEPNIKFRIASVLLKIGFFDREGPTSVEAAAKFDVIRSLGVLATSPLHHVPAGFAHPPADTPHRHVVYHGGNGAFRLDYTGRNAALKLRAVTPYRVTPEHSGPTTVLPSKSANALQTRRAEIAGAYGQLSGSPPSILMYLIEAYRLVPLSLARALQEAGAYDEALTWYRLVFDFLATPAEQKIDHGLVLEEDLDFDFDDIDHWLGDTANVHGIAASRRGTWTRHVILSIAGCLIEQGDGLFATDAPADLIRAGELYRQALDLLDHFGKPFGICDQIIGELEIDVTEGVQLPFESFQLILANVHNPGRLRNMTESLAVIARDASLSRAERVRLIRGGLNDAVQAEPRAASVGERIDSARSLVQSVETRMLAAPAMRDTLAKIARSRSLRRRNAANEIEHLRARSGEQRRFEWMRARPESAEVMLPIGDLAAAPVSRSAALAGLAPMRSLAIAEPEPAPPALGGLTIGFCIPQNPIVQTLRARAESNLEKLRTCRNIAGFERALNPYGGPIGLGAGIGREGVIAARVVAPNTVYRYSALRARALELVTEAEQVEARYQAALVAAEEAEFRELQFRQQAKLAQARTRLADLRIDTAQQQIGLARLQQAAAEFSATTYQGWIDAGLNEHENGMLASYADARRAQLGANSARTVAAVAQAAAHASGALRPMGAGSGLRGLINEIRDNVNGGIAAAAHAAAGVAAGVEGGFNAENIRAQHEVQKASFKATHERRNDEWELQKGRAEHETRIAGQQITIARSQLRITRQEREIAAIEQANAEDLLEYLISMDFTAELHRWIAGVLGRIYRGYLQQATATAQLAEALSAWESQKTPSGLIKTDYWLTAPSATEPVAPEAASRLGLTGSARLKFDIQTLEQRAFESRGRDDPLTLTLDLEQLLPIEFQRFRETGILVFDTPLSMIEREFPGHYLCLVRALSLSVVALVPPTRGIRASLTSGGPTSVVVEGDSFPTITLNARPERVAFTGTAESVGAVPLTAEDAALRGVYDGIGFGGRWQLEMQRAVNPFDYDSIATVLISFDLTTRFSFDYRRQLLERRDPKVEGEISFSFRNSFPDAWYDLLNPDLSSEPMRVRFRTDQRSFPRNVRRQRIAQAVFYAVRADGEQAEVSVSDLRFQPDGESSRFGGGFITVDGRASTRSASGVNLLPIIGQKVSGEWDLTFVDDDVMENRPRSLFAEERIEDLLLVVSFRGEEEPWSN